MKLCLVASSGGHYEQIMKISKLFTKYEGIIVTEKTMINNKADYYFPQVNRKELSCIIKMLKIIIISIKILLFEKPDAIISTGALCCVPLCFLGKVIGKKIIFIESFAKVNTPTKTGKLIYKISDLFIIQWETLRKHYPKAIYGGSIY